MSTKSWLISLEFDPPHGISVWAKGDSTFELEAVISGLPEESPYAKGTFHLSVNVPERYPFEPPKVRFMTSIYHPNIDDGGRICMDVLKMPPKGSWKPAQNISTVLTSVWLLLLEPNPDDPLMADIAKEYREDRSAFNVKAAAMTDSVVAAKEAAAVTDSVVAAKEAAAVTDSVVAAKEAAAVTDLLWLQEHDTLPCQKRTLNSHKENETRNVKPKV